MLDKKQYTRLDAVGGSIGKATVETVVDTPEKNVVPLGDAEWVARANVPKKKIKVTSGFGRIMIEDLTPHGPLSRLQNNTLILQLTNGDGMGNYVPCVRPSQDEHDYVKKLAAIIRKGLTE